MERRTRVYPAQRPWNRWLSLMILGIAAVLAAGGLLRRNTGAELSVEPLSTAAPLALEERFDETPAKQEISLPASEWYALQLGAFENEEAARALADQYVSRGAAGYVWHDGRYRVLAAAYPAKDDAQLVREQLQLVHGIESYLHQVRLPEISLRISGMQGQLDILQAALIHANDLVCELQRMSVAMDRQEMNAQEAIDALQSLNEQVSLVELRLRQRFASPRHAAVDALLNGFRHYAAFCETLQSHMSQVELGAGVKHQTLLALEGLKNVYDILSHT